jgi:CHAD domain-containing protein
MALAPRLPSRCSNGELVAGLVQRHVARLVALQAPVLKDTDPEPLHQMRVAMRRLRTTLRQFAPALVLPSGVSDQRLAKSVRRLGMARDLDVLRERLDQDLLPGLPGEEQAALKPVFRQLKRERRVAYGHLEEVLRGHSHLELLARLQDWLREPVFTPLGREPLHHWLNEWQLPPVLELFAHPGWWLEDPQADADVLHQLRKQIKGVRYRLENLRGSGGRRQLACIASLRNLQDLLGDLHDLEVLAKAIDHQMSRTLETDLPVLARLLHERRDQAWGQWRQQALAIHGSRARRALVDGLRREASRHRWTGMCSAIHGRVAVRMARIQRPH